MTLYSNPENPLTIHQVTSHLQELISQDTPNLWIAGEIQSLSFDKSNHCYMDLIDRSGPEPALIRSIVWRHIQPKLPQKPEQGTKIVAYGRISYYAPRGNYSFCIEDLRAQGMGDQKALLDALYRKLAEEGLFSPQRKRKLPFLPKGIGIVTSRTGAALRDICKTLQPRSPQIPLFLYPSLVQGVRAPEEIVEGIQQLGQDPRIDWIIVSRGGGSSDDLSAFNDERVVRAIASCPKPVITAIGHERDLSLSDLASDRYTFTPTAAAMLVPDRNQLYQALADYNNRLAFCISQKLLNSKQLHSHITARLLSAVRIDPRKLSLQQLRSRLEQVGPNLLKAQRLRLQNLAQRLQQQAPSLRLAEEKNKLAHHREHLQTAIHQLLDAQKRRLQQSEGALTPQTEAIVAASRIRFSHKIAELQALSPLACLSRGYSIARQSGQVLKSVEQVHAGPVELLLADGRIEAEVIAIHKKHE